MTLIPSSTIVPHQLSLIQRCKPCSLGREGGGGWVTGRKVRGRRGMVSLSAEAVCSVCSTHQRSVSQHCAMAHPSPPYVPHQPHQLCLIQRCKPFSICQNYCTAHIDWAVSSTETVCLGIFGGMLRLFAACALTLISFSEYD